MKTLKNRKTVADITELAAQWHPTKNGDLKPEFVSTGSSQKVWWKCDRGHEWDASVYSRVRGHNCRYCFGNIVKPDNCLSKTQPDLASSWHPTKNGDLTPKDVAEFSNKKVWWKCEKGHEWNATVASRAKGNRCPYCSGQKTCSDNCLASTHPELAAQWHPTKNGNLTPYDSVAGSGKLVWWRCQNNFKHEWSARLVNRRNGSGCPYCAGKKTCSDNCLASTHPELAAQWHPTKNGNLTPHNITAGSHKKVWCQCKKNSKHEWKSQICRIKRCPYCARKKACRDNCLAITHPELASQWHPSKNGNLTPYDVVSGCNKKFYWMCGKGHEWESTVNHRTCGHNCPVCNQSKGENKVAAFLKQINLRFKREVRFKKCKLIRPLPFDFIVKLPNGKGILIEYQGVQHYKPIRRSRSWTKKKTLYKFKEIQERDKIKSEWANKNKIPLIVIPYWEYENIPSFIGEFLGTLK
jgi:hypothetical protein